MQEELDVTAEKWASAAEEAGNAESQVATYEKTMGMLHDPEERTHATEYFAGMKQRAEETGKAVRENVVGAFSDVHNEIEKRLSADDKIRAEADFTILGVEYETKQARNVCEEGLNSINGTLTSINDVSTVTQNAKNTIEKALTGLTGSVEYINTSNAVVSAWNSMQGWLNDNPLTSWVRQVTTNVSNGGGLWNSLWGHADGGIMTSPHVGLVAEAGPEAIIPLSSARRGRAMSLYREVGGILGVGSGSVTSNTNNSVNINVYASPTQTADEIAEVVSRKINTQLRRKGAVFA